MEFKAFLYPKGGPTHHVVLTQTTADVALITEMVRRVLDLDRARKNAKATLVLAEDYATGGLGYKSHLGIINGRFEFNKIFFDSSVGGGNTITLTAKNATSLKFGPVSDFTLTELTAKHVGKNCPVCGSNSDPANVQCVLCETASAANVL